ncbi:hypothetical protein P152DRAFT_414576 [Eremomyces bilateralis CBS 781.70]|uniref:Uncharacterized protein n=1 Tax=Eremomyces bilateralis CBS 781.70 TaxID=1392243 RepID=A0A6G1G7K1_9PEZI|nr:uncharacterized protein P152DRAFT_414576 [Eremomyces bilateralis CBS 781.70]KAF1814004.1 hypothetical protein P152DRAFT_414576 [Eremomyces bilateralis CBS 781.70]
MKPKPWLNGNVWARNNPFKHRLLSTSRVRFQPEPSRAPNTRIARIADRLPPRLRRYVSPLLNAPVSHVTSFLILHELTAILPLIGLTSAFHYLGWIPEVSGPMAEWVNQGTERFRKYFARKGWFGLGGEGYSEVDLSNGTTDEAELSKGYGGKVVLEVATAYAITKVLLPARLALSVSATPWFARLFVLPIIQIFKR